MQPQKATKITIIGAGLTGSFLALLLAKRGYKVQVYERMTREKTLASSQRSINISFHNYTANALKTVGVWAEVKKGVIPLRGSVTKLPHYPPILASFENLKLDYFSAKREKILKALVAKAKSYPNITFSFGTELLNVDRTNRTLLLKTLTTGKVRTETTEILIGADGVNSTVRAFMQRGQHTEHMQRHSGWEYKQIQFSPETVKKLGFHTNRAYSSTRKEAIFVSLPDIEGTFSGMLALSPAIGYASLPTDQAKTDFIRRIFPELAPALPEILPALTKNPNGSFITMKTYPWTYKDFIAIVGDAGHSVTPFIGHGVTIGFGDALTLVRAIDTHKGNWANAFASYQDTRKKNVDVLVDMSLESFVNFQRERKASYPIIYAAFESLLHKTMPFAASSSIFERIVSNPDDAYSYKTDHTQQRKRFTYVGIPLLVTATTLGILGAEKILEKVTRKA